MPNLYEIDKSILSCFDAETGEVFDADALESLHMDRAKKVESLACLIKNRLSDAAAIEAEAAALAERAAAKRRSAESLTQYLAGYLNNTAFESPRCSVSFRRSTRVDVNVLELPAEYFRETTKVSRTPDKKAITAILKSGTTIPGCKLVDHYNPEIK